LVGCVCLQKSEKGVDIGFRNIAVVSGVERDGIALNLVRPRMIRQVFRVIIHVLA
jgi:hypothetical protein